MVKEKGHTLKPHIHEIFAAELRDVAQRLHKLRLAARKLLDLLAESGPPHDAEKIARERTIAEREEASFGVKIEGIEAFIGGRQEEATRPRDSLRLRIQKGFEWMLRTGIGIERRRERFPPVEPTTKLGLVGLALSGGGIRSATFNLGVLQVLARDRLLRHVDYLSTVSGGGYIGSCLSSLFTDPQVGDGDRFPFEHEVGELEPEALTHLRSSGNYLAPNGLLDLLRIPALLIRGAIVNFLVLLPYIVFFVLLIDLTYGDSIRAAALSAIPVDWSEFYRLSWWGLLLFLGFVLLFPLLNALGALDRFRQWFRDRWGVRDKYELAFAIGLLAVATLFVLGALPAAVVYYHRFVLSYSWGEAATWVVGAASVLATMFAGKATANISKLRGKLALYALGLLGPLVILVVYLALAEFEILGFPPTSLTVPLVGELPFDLFGYALILWAYTAWGVDPNSTSLHSFYRDRLSKAYLFGSDHNGDVDPRRTNDGLKLTQLTPSGGIAPYHLINATVNLQGSDDPTLFGRQADFFIFSKRFVGSVRTEYCTTEAMEAVEPRLNLGTAMAISGAAAAPNMGTTTVKPLVFLMTLLNVRLGYWLPNPGKLGEFGIHKLFPRPGPILLLKELFSRITGRSIRVNVSDGGHIENLGIYELLRRRCKYIIACDAGQDRELQFGALAKLIRYARIDRGIEIDIDLTDINGVSEGKGKGRRSRRHWALGTITYGKDKDGNPEKGYLLYIKSSITDDENPYIKEYQDRHSDFPHETTADQFFSEEQFEAYRALGYHIANDLFPVSGLAGEKLDVPPDADSICRWFNYLTTGRAARERKHGDVSVECSEL